MKYDPNMKAFYKDIIMAIQSLIGKSEIEKVKKLAADGNAALLREYLKENHGRSCHGSSVYYYETVGVGGAEFVDCTPQQMKIKFNHIINNSGDYTLDFSWSQVCTFIRYHIDDIFPDIEEKTVPKEENRMTGPAFNFGNFISESNALKQLPLNLLLSRHNHRFKLYDGERLQDMIQSIKANGVLTPIIVLLINEALVKNIEDELNSCADEDKREKLAKAAEFYRSHIDEYEILAGHNRCNAARIAGKTTVPGIVKENLSYDEAEMYVAETNFMQRGFDDLSITERASVLAARHSAMFDEDKRNAIVRELAVLNGEEVEADAEDNKKSKLAAVGENYGLSKDTVARLIRIDKLVPELKPYVDEGRIAIRAAVNLSYLFTSEQKKVAEMIEFGVDMKKSTLLREVSRQNKLNDNAIREILVMGTYGTAPTTKKKPIKVKISTDISEKYFAPDWDEAKVQDIINLALEQYFSKQLPESELDSYGLSEKCLSILKANGMENKEMIDEWLSFGDGEKILGEKYHYEVMKKIFDSEDEEEFANGELDDDFSEFDED